MPPYLAGREEEKEQFGRLLEQTDILENMILTGLRGVGKTVLLENAQTHRDRSGVAVGRNGSLGIRQRQ